MLQGCPKYVLYTGQSGGKVLDYKVSYIVYNNQDFKRMLFCETKEEAQELADKLGAMPHVSGITITYEVQLPKGDKC